MKYVVCIGTNICGVYLGNMWCIVRKCVMYSAWCVVGKYAVYSEEICGV